MIPLKDENQTNNKCYIRLVILIVLALFFFSNTITQQLLDLLFWIQTVKFVPKGNISIIPRLFNSYNLTFFHGGWMHFLGNMLYLWIFADNVEDKLGVKNLLFFIYHLEFLLR